VPVQASKNAYQWAREVRAMMMIKEGYQWDYSKMGAIGENRELRYRRIIDLL
jgi:hypothetical protein